MDVVTVTLLAVGYVVAAICLASAYVEGVGEPKRRWTIAWLTVWPVLLAGMAVGFVAWTLWAATREIAAVLRGDPS